MVFFLLKRFALVVLLGFTLSSYSFAFFNGGTCSDIRYSCATVVGGLPSYSNSAFASPNIDFDFFADPMGTGITVLNVDATDWDLGKFGEAFVVTVRTGKSYTFDNYGLFMVESIGGLDSSQTNEELIQNDEVTDTAGSSYLVFEDYGSVVQVQGSFINQGETIIYPDAKYVFTPVSTGEVLYSEIFTVGGSGGTTTLLRIMNPSFSFRILNIENAELEVYDVTNVIISGVDREINLNGNVTATIGKVDIENRLFKSSFNINITNDNNIITFEYSSMMWAQYSSILNTYVEGEGPSMYFTCSSYCTGNSIILSNSEVHMNTLSLVDVALLNINMSNNSRYNVEHFVLENSNLVYTIDNSTYESSLSSFTMTLNTGSIFIDEKSSFVINANNSDVHFHDTDYEVDGIFEINVSDNSVVSMFEETEITGNGSIYLNFETDSRGSFEEIKLLGTNLSLNFATSSGAIFKDLSVLNNSSFSASFADDSSSYLTKANFDSSQDSYFNFTGSSTGSFQELALSGGNVYINYNDGSSGEFYILQVMNGANLYVNLKGTSTISFNEDIEVNGNLYIEIQESATIIFNKIVNGVGEVNFDVQDDSYLYFTSAAEINTKVTINQEVIFNSSNRSIVKFDKASTFLDDDLVYNFTLNSTNALPGYQPVLLLIKNDGPLNAFPYEAEVNAKIGNNSSFSSVLLSYGGGLIGYANIGSSDQYAEFGVQITGAERAQDQYGEGEGLLTLTTTENMDGYEVAVVFDNIMLSTTDREPYRATLFNVVINNSRTVEQLGQTLNSLNANITLSNILYSTSILEMSDQKNATALLNGERFTAYAEARNLANDSFEGKYLVLGSSFMFYASKRYRFGLSGFFSPYMSTTIYDSKEQSGNAGVSLYGAIQIGDNGGAVMLDASIMHSVISGTNMEILSGMNKREYFYGGNSAGATLSYNFGGSFSQRMIVSAFITQSSDYTEDSSDLALHVVSPVYYNAFAGYYSKLINGKTFTLEIGIKYYFIEGQKIGTAGFVNDPAGQEWGYQYVLLNSPVELNASLSYRLFRSLEIQAGASKRGTYNNFGLYLMYKKSLFGPEDEDEDKNEDEDEDKAETKKEKSGNLYEYTNELDY